MSEMVLTQAGQAHGGEVRPFKLAFFSPINVCSPKVTWRCPENCYAYIRQWCKYINATGMMCDCMYACPLFILPRLMRNGMHGRLFHPGLVLNGMF